MRDGLVITALDCMKGCDPCAAKVLGMVGDEVLSVVKRWPGRYPEILHKLLRSFHELEAAEETERLRREEEKQKARVVTEEDLGRLWSKVEKTDGCWLWKGSKIRGKYGCIRWLGKTVYATRLIWEFERGPVPPKQLLFCCQKTSNCVRPDHMTLKTTKEHARQAIETRWAKVKEAKK